MESEPEPPAATVAPLPIKTPICCDPAVFPPRPSITIEPDVVDTELPLMISTPVNDPEACAPLSASSVMVPLVVVRLAETEMFRGAVREMFAVPVLMACVMLTVSTPVLPTPFDSVNAVPPWNVICCAVLLPLADSVMRLTLATEKDVVPVMSPARV